MDTCYECIYKISDGAIFCMENNRLISDEFAEEGCCKVCEKFRRSRYGREKY